MKSCCAALLVVLVFLGARLHAGPLAGDRAEQAAAARMERKLNHIRSNGSAARPDPAPTVFTEDEISAYFAAGKAGLPPGVRSVRFQAQPGVVTANASVDFDQLRANRGSLNPLLEIFTGIHETVVVAHAYGSAGEAHVDIDSVTIDGVEIPRFVLQLFAEKFLQPKYPGVGLSSKFALPDRIDSATVGLRNLTVVQK
jgi:hypothetical protein